LANIACKRLDNCIYTIQKHLLFNERLLWWKIYLILWIIWYKNYWFKLNIFRMKTSPSFLLIIVLLTIGHCRLISHHEESLKNEHQQIVNVKPFSNISNLAANNWILGNMTLDQYNEKRFEITKNFNTSLCPN
jgi:hypothetical protein